MRYLFYDVECSNCFNGEGKMCSFGYVITDCDFNVIDKRDIVMNPASRFYLRRKDGKPEIELAYSEEYFKSQPKFDNFYEEIKEMLEYPDQLVMGHSILNDVKHLAYQCKRYKFPCINYRFGDSQLIYKKFINGGHQVGLAKICEEYDIQPEHLHRSDDDAWATMEFVRKFCGERHITLDKLLSDNPELTGSIEDFEVTLSGISVTRSKRFLQRQLEEYTKLLNPAQEGTLKGKRVCISKKFERDNADLCGYICKRVFECGGRYTRNAMRCNTFVKVDEVPCTRENSINADKKLSARVAMIGLDRLYELIGMDNDAAKKEAAAFSLDDVVTLPPVAYGKKLKVTVGERVVKQQQAAPEESVVKPKKKRKRRRKKKSEAKAQTSDGEGAVADDNTM
ncbi:MAG: hypothetical protein K2M44_01100 [Clostridia bacterium]|nr:hypothetical protein [Clostridia bacterium]